MELEFDNWVCFLFSLSLQKFQKRGRVQIGAVDKRRKSVYSHFGAMERTENMEGHPSPVIELDFQGGMIVIPVSEEMKARYETGKCQIKSVRVFH